MNASSFRKQFQRVRQNIDQNLGRAEKTEVLSEEEQYLDRRVELLKSICHNIQKKLQPCLRSLSLSTDPEKRMKKLPESSLSHSLIECSVQLDQSTASGQVFQLVGDLEGKLAQEIFKFEVDVEGRTLKLVQNILENDYPSIQKLKKQLNSKTLDMDAAKARYQSAMRQLQTGAVPQQKVDETKIDYEDAIGRVETTKDQLATEMYSFTSKETDINQCLYELVEIQAEFHRQSLSCLERVMPQIQECINFRVQKPVFGISLIEHVETRSRDVALVLEECVQYLVENGLEEEGLFRLAGSSSKMKKLKSAFNSNISSGSVIAGVDEVDVHVIAGVLKQYLRELPDPLMTCDLYSDWMKATELPADQVANYLKDVSSKLPRVYYANLKYLIKFLKKLSENSDVNKMSPANIGLVMGPNLIWAPGDVGPNMMTTGLQSSLVEMLVMHANHIFPGDINFSSGSHQSPNIPINMLPALSQHDANLIVKSPQYNVLPSYQGQQPDGGGRRTDSETSNNNNVSSTPPPPSQTITQQHPTPTTLKKSKKQPAPQPPPPTYPYEGGAQHQQQTPIAMATAPTTPQQQQPLPSQPPQQQPVHHQSVMMSTSEYTPSSSTNRLEKPRVPPPERPNVPPPDKPGKPIFGMDQQQQQQLNNVAPAPGFIGAQQFSMLRLQHNVPHPYPQAMPQPQQVALPDVAAAFSNRPSTPNSYNTNSQQQQQQDSSNNSSNGVSNNSDLNNSRSSPAIFYNNNNSSTFQLQQQGSLASSSSSAASAANQSPSLGGVQLKPLYPYLGPSESSGSAVPSSPLVAPKTHSRNSSIGSKPPPPRPHPPLPPKKGDLKQTDN